MLYVIFVILLTPTYLHYFTSCTLHLCVPQYATRSFSDVNTNPAPEHTWSLSSKEVKALAHASGSDYVYALTEDEVGVGISPAWCM